MVEVKGRVVRREAFVPVVQSADFREGDQMTSQAGKPARLVVREYERYDTDRTIPEFRAGATGKRRVVEERLVYTAFFGLWRSAATSVLRASARLQACRHGGPEGPHDDRQSSTDATRYLRW